MNKHAKRWMNTTLAVGLLSSGLLMGGGITAEASSVPSPSVTSPYYSQEKQAFEAVVKAEQSRSLADVKIARVKVDGLKPSALKSSLQSRLKNLELSIYRDINQAMSMISKAEKTKLPEDIYNAKKYSSIVKDPSALKEFKSRLIPLENALVSQAISLVEKAESTYLHEYVVKARQAVSYLDNTSTKSSLMKRLDVLDWDIQDLNRANQQVGLLESSYDQALIPSAKSAVSLVNKVSFRDSLFQRITNVERDIKDFEIANSYVKKLEVSYDRNMIAPAKKYASLVDKASFRDSLNQRIARMEKQISLQDLARSLVAKAEVTKNPAEIERAYYYVNQLENLKVKQELLQRLKAIYPIYVYPMPIVKPDKPIIVNPTPIDYPIVTPVEPIEKAI